MQSARYRTCCERIAFSWANPPVDAAIEAPDAAVGAAPLSKAVVVPPGVLCRSALPCRFGGAAGGFGTRAGFRIADAGGRALGQFCRGLTYAGFLPEAVRIVAPALPWGFKAARKIGFMPPSIPVVTGWWAFRG